MCNSLVSEEEVTLALTQRSPTASTQPRKGQTPSASTISKLKKAMGDPSKTKYGITLRQGIQRAPDGGAVADYPKGWRYLPPTYALFTPAQGYSSGQIEVSLTEEQTDRLRNHTRVKDAMDRLHNLSGIPKTYNFQRFSSDAEKQAYYNKVAKYQKVIDDHLFSQVIAPQIKADQEMKRKYEEDQKQTIATLKMRVLELEKPIYEPITKITTDRSWSKYAILGIGVVIFLIILRRRA